MKSQHINFTEKAIAALPIPAKEQGQAIYYDSGSTDGLMLIVTYGGTKTYYHYMFFNKRPVRTKIGRSSQIKLAVARARAHTMAENATKGIDPGEKRRENLHDITFKQFYETVYRPEYSIVYGRPYGQADRHGDGAARSLKNVCRAFLPSSACRSSRGRKLRFRIF